METLVLSRLRMWLVCFSYISAIIAVIFYSIHFWRENEPFYRIDVDYTRWASNLPAFTVCPAMRFSTKSSSNRRTQTNGIQFPKSILSPWKNYCKSCQKLDTDTMGGIELRAVTENLTEPCENILIHCIWNDRPFQCCRHFRKIWTWKGPCFSFNSVHTRETEVVPLDVTTSFHKPRADLMLELTVDVRVYVHDRKDLDFFTGVRKIPVGGKANILYSFIEWSEDSSSWLLPLSERNCTLEEEESLEGFSVYSQSACRLKCLAEEQKRKCGCTHHIITASVSDDCDISGLMCLKMEFGDLTTHYRSVSCNCWEECSKQEVNYIQYLIEESFGITSEVNVSLSAPPTHRFVLTSKLTILKFIVSLACLSRLVTKKTVQDFFRDGFIIQRWQHVLKEGNKVKIGTSNIHSRLKEKNIFNPNKISKVQ